MTLSLVPRSTTGDFKEAKYQFIAGGEGEVYRIYSDSVGIPTLGAGYALARRTPVGIVLEKRATIEGYISAALANSRFEVPFKFTDAEWARLESAVELANLGLVSLAQSYIPAAQSGQGQSLVAALVCRVEPGWRRGRHACDRGVCRAPAVLVASAGTDAGRETVRQDHALRQDRSALGQAI